MNWPDLVISIVSTCFGFTIIPQVIDSIKGKSFINIYTSVMTVGGLFSIGVAYSALGLWMSSIPTFFTCCMWIILFTLSLRERRKKSAGAVIG